MAKPRIFTCTLALLALTVGCTGVLAASGAQVVDDVYLLSNKQPGGGGDAALLTGTLELSQNCLIIEADFGTNYSPVWPYGYSYKRGAGGVEVVDASGEVVARVGERVGVGGSGLGPVAYAELDKYVSGNLSCPQPFWGVVEIVSAL